MRESDEMVEGTLEQAKELKVRLEALKEEERDIESKLRAIERGVQPKPQYGNMQANVTLNYKNWDGKMLGEVVRLVDHLLNEQEKNDHMALFGSISGDWKASRGSVGYYRNEYGVLDHDGGGWILMRDGIPCSDEEWEEIKQGRIPDKFKK